MRLARRHGREIGPADVARVLREAGVRYVVVGAHAANGYNGRPRTTVDVDVAVRFPRKAAKAIAAKFPQLQMRDTPVAIRFIDGDFEAIDLLKPTNLLRRLLEETREVKIEGGNVRIPVLEGVLAAKFAAMASFHRRTTDKLQDGADFMRIIDANEQIDLKLLNELGDLVYPEGGEFLLKLVADARAGRRLEF